MGQLKKLSVIIFFILVTMGQVNAQQDKKPWLTPEKLANTDDCKKIECLVAQIQLNNTFIKGESALVDIQVDNSTTPKRFKRSYVSISEDKNQIKLVTCFMIKNIKTEEIISTPEPPHMIFENFAISERPIEHGVFWPQGMQISYQIDLNEFPEFETLEPGNYEITFVIMPDIITIVYPTGPFSFTIKEKKGKLNRK